MSEILQRKNKPRFAQTSSKSNRFIGCHDFALWREAAKYPLCKDTKGRY